MTTHTCHYCQRQRLTVRKRTHFARPICLACFLSIIVALISVR